MNCYKVSPNGLTIYSSKYLFAHRLLNFLSDITTNIWHSYMLQNTFLIHGQEMLVKNSTTDTFI